MTTYRQADAAALANAGYGRHGTGEWRISNCTVSLRDIGHGIWSIEIHSRRGTIAAMTDVEDLMVKNVAP
jgi:hypothetical protein